MLISFIFTNFVLPSNEELIQHKPSVTNVTFGQRTLQGKLSPVLISLQEFPNSWVSTPYSIKVFTVTMAVNLFFGNLFSALVFRLIWKNELKPINVMTCIDEGFKMVGYTWNIWVITLSANRVFSDSPQPPLATYTGEDFCHISYFIGATGVVSNIGFGLGIALMRLLYVRYPTKIQSIEFKMAGGILLACFTIIFTVTCAFFLSPKKTTTTDDLCLGFTREMVIVLCEYKTPNNNPIIFHFIISFGFLFVTSEFFIYLNICFYLYKHDQSMKSIIPDRTLRSRNNKNAMDMFGHMFSFFLDNIILILSSIKYVEMQSDLAKVLLQALALSNYGINGLCQILLSRRLQLELLKFLDTIFFIPLLSKVLGFFSYIGLLSPNYLQFRTSYME